MTINDLTELEQLNLDVAAIAGWSNIRLWDNSRSQERKPKKRLFVGNNDRKELGIFVPNYTSDLNAITDVFGNLKLGWTLSSLGYASCGIFDAYATNPPSPAIALCKLLIELNPKPIAKAEVVEATFG